MKYYKIESGIANPYTIEECPSIPTESWDDLPITFRTGRSIDGKVPNPLVFKINHPASIKPEPFIEATYPVVNNVFIRVLEESGVDNYQLFPAVLKNMKNEMISDDYHALNIIGLRDCVLLKDCDYDTIIEGTKKIPAVMGFHSYVFSVEKLKDEPRMFRLAQGRDLFISDHVMKVLQSIMPLSKWNISATEIPVK